MLKQFLLNPDGSVPKGVNVQALIEENISLVVPVPPPRASGMVAVEQPAQPDENGILKQVWVLEPAPVEEPI